MRLSAPLTLRAVMIAFTALPLLSGCVAAAIPVIAAGAIGKNVVDKKKGGNVTDMVRPPEQEWEDPAVPTAQTVPQNEPLSEAVIPVADGKEAAGSRPNPPILDGAFGAYAPLVAYADRQQEERAGQFKEKSVVLMPSKSLDAPNFTVCDTLPSAILVELDFNGGLERDAVTGATSQGGAAAFNALRERGIKVIYMSSLPSTNADTLSAALDAAGLGPAVHGDTLWLVGDRGSYNKDSLRWKIASYNCIIAMAGDAPSDFSILMGDRERVDAPDVPPLVAQLNNAGWFVVPSLLSRIPDGENQ